MSEWMTTGQALDRMEIDSVVENARGDRMYWEDSHLIVKSSNGNKYLHLLFGLMDIEWRFVS